jgi:hypothetical protein
LGNDYPIALDVEHVRCEIVGFGGRMGKGAFLHPYPFGYLLGRAGTARTGKQQFDQFFFS